MTSEQEFAEMLAPGYERRGMEFKGARERTNKLFFAKVVRAVLGMANRRDGGRVVIGVDEDNRVLTPTGLTQEQLQSWGYDEIAVSVAEYADPSVSFDAEVVPYKENNFVILHVREFDELPVLCKRDYQHSTRTKPMVLRRGDCYVRSRRKPETSAIPSQEEMRELLDLAIEKGVRRFLTRAYRVGLPLGPTTPPGPTDAQRFEAQLGDLR